MLARLDRVGGCYGESHEALILHVFVSFALLIDCFLDQFEQGLNKSAPG